MEAGLGLTMRFMVDGQAWSGAVTQLLLADSGAALLPGPCSISESSVRLNPATPSISFQFSVNATDTFAETIYSQMPTHVPRLAQITTPITKSQTLRSWLDVISRNVRNLVLRPLWPVYPTQRIPAGSEQSVSIVHWHSAQSELGFKDAPPYC